ncbi:homoserine O-succinyltransferase [Methylocapsa sp. S129]|uniref:homoserine O-succinyltransferase MetA n=1 Tax=Methylocapsa sp. S129 TaxID=1641869 RepID=UPI00131E8299|nr:homoserine O-succinyltransferase [Methylocapsa sp. S129]
MPVTVERLPPTGVAQLGNMRERRVRRGTIRDRGKTIEIGLVNNMPDAALLATERQFFSLLDAACGSTDVRLHLFALRDVPRSDEARGALARTHQDAGQLRSKRLDALIVTGAEPVAPTLAKEPYWRALTALIDWADSNTVSTILSCLAAHVGVQHFDGIERQPLPAKCSGLFAFETVARDKLVSDLSSGVLTPHSRRNGLSQQDLVDRGYQALTYDSEIGVDIFIKQKQSLFVFLQGHPEYEDDSLAREYRRDMNRFLRGEQDALPAIPHAYFPVQVERALAAFAERAWLERRPELMAAFPDAGGFGPGHAPWRKSAIQLYRNWLDIIAERKAALLEDAPIAVARWGG